MSKPDDIPQDVWEAAYAVLVKLMRGALATVNGKTAMQDIETIARAIMAEREACAAIIDASMLCENAAGDEVLLPRGTSGNEVGFAYAAAIRKRSVA